MKRALTFIFLFGFLASKSQLPEYYVYLVKGDVVQKKQNGQAMPVKQNALVYKTDVVVLKKDAAVTLVNGQQQSLVLTTGIYRVAELGRKLYIINTGITKQYLSMLWHELVNPGRDNAKLSKKDLAASWGGLSTRGDLCNNRIFPINGLKTATDSVQFKWQQTSPSHTYKLQLFDGAGAEIVSKEIRDTQALLPVKEAVNNKSGKYYWLVKSSDATCEDEVPFYFEIMSKEDEAKLTQALLPPSSGDEIMDKLQEIDKLEKQAMIYAASDQFAKLIGQYPGNEALKKSYISFLLKYGFDKEASLLWTDSK